ncbi:hypothetical protein HNQ96_006195 [Aminobacter lissarensis]|uniref:Uncharacterized protein n=1 Tax=Aminobacter carboxidus TaxID=376165 RepID=A0A8E1WKP1_9HYPH|nr:hypothetical protein [Aminobacter lissarensis]MBB6470298.1 hypothetical protein [Aminobacter lissarensis]
MPLGECCYNPYELDLMARVLAKCLPPAATKAEKERQAAALVCLYGTGITNEARLLELLIDGSHKPYHEVKTAA